MDRTELITAIVAALLLMFLLGWVLRWAYGKLNRIGSADMSEIDDLANRLHEAEQAKDNAEAYAREVEQNMRNQLAQVQAELDAAMSGLGEARREADALRQQTG